MTSMTTGAPAQKVTVASFAAAATVVLITVLEPYLPETLPLAKIQAELVVIVTFLAGYMMPPSKNDQVDPG